MRVKVEVTEIELAGDHGTTINSIEVICSRCSHRVEVYGTSDRSVRRGCIMLRQECPQEEENYYANEDN